MPTLRTASEMAITMEVGDAEITLKFSSATTGSEHRAAVTPILERSRPCKHKCTVIFIALIIMHVTTQS